MLSQKEFAEKRAKNHCFYCDKKYVPGHKCEGQMFTLEIKGTLVEECLEEDEEEESNMIAYELSEQTSQSLPHISLNALSKILTHNTMRLKGRVLKQILHILMDSRSTHNFLDIYVAKRLGCRIRNTCPLEVSVAGGSKLVSQYMVKAFQWKIQTVLFEIDVMLLSLGGCEMVLGVYWLSTLGTIQWNFKDLIMQFYHEGKKCSTHQNEVVDAELNHLLEEYANVFEVPKELPPQRSFDHRIPLKEDNVAINIRPYRYPPNQKDTIEAMVKELLDSWVIRPSNSPFLSPIVMVTIEASLKAQEAFERLQQVMIQSSVLALPNFNEEFVIETDTSGFGIGAVLQQNKHPIAYLSKTLALKNQSMSTYEKELLAVVLALQKWRGYRLDRHFKIRTDHFSLKYVLDQRITTPFQSKWLPKLVGFDYEIEYKKSADNATADALSRIERQSVLFSLLAGTSNELMDVVIATWSTDLSLQAVIQGLQDKTLVNSKPLPKGLPPISIGRFLFKLLQVKLKMSTAYHPQTDGQTEIVNKCLETYLRSPPMHTPYMTKDSPVEAVDRTLQAREQVVQLLRFNLKKAQNMMKSQADKKKSDRNFQINDWVLEKIGKVAYKLRLPDYAKVHHVFYVSQLKPCYIDSSVMGSFPLCDSEVLLAATPLKLLDRRMVKQINRMVVFGLIQWSNGSEEDATWEKLEDLLARFPEFTLDP
ncbi:reverse transcriptase [Tanacetum coccineum]